jgi:CrcB protein
MMAKDTTKGDDQPFKARWDYAAVFVGGAVGSITREIIAPFGFEAGWLSGTFVANIIACFIIGWLYAIRHRIHAHVLHLGAVGFCGGLSTFSTLAADLFDVIQMGHYLGAVRSFGLEVTFGIAAALIGEMIGRRRDAPE